MPTAAPYNCSRYLHPATARSRSPDGTGCSLWGPLLQRGTVIVEAVPGGRFAEALLCSGRSGLLRVVDLVNGQYTGVVNGTGGRTCCDMRGIESVHGITVRPPR